jgi:hypothetical protein
LVYFKVIWYIFPILVCCTKKNLATLHSTKNWSPRKSSQGGVSKWNNWVGNHRSEVNRECICTYVVIFDWIQGDRTSLWNNRPKCSPAHFLSPSMHM